MSAETHPRVVAIIQARMSSTRLPGKALIDLCGRPMLERVVTRVRRARTLHEVVVATTTEPLDDVIVTWCQDFGCAFSRGSRDDVLDRYAHAAQEHNADVIVRITSDCPMIDPDVIDLIVDRFLSAVPPYDYLSNTYEERTFPRGLDVEVFSRAALDQAHRDDQSPAYREHVTPYLYRNAGTLFRVGTVRNPLGDHGRHRWTVDTPEDLELARRLRQALGDDDRDGQADALAVLDAYPDWMLLNGDVEQKTVAH